MIRIDFYNDCIPYVIQAYNILMKVKEVDGKIICYKWLGWDLEVVPQHIYRNYKSGDQEIHIVSSILDVYQDPFPLLFSRPSAKDSQIYIRTCNNDETDIVIELLKVVLDEIPTEAYKRIKLRLFRCRQYESLEEAKEEIMTKNAEGNITVDVVYCNNSKNFSAEDAKASAQNLVDLLKKAKIRNISEVVLADYFRMNKDGKASMRALLYVRAAQMWDIRPLYNYLFENKETLEPLMLSGFHLKLPERESEYHDIYWPY